MTLLTFILGFVAFTIFVGALWFAGRADFVRSIIANEEAWNEVNDFHEELINFANSDGRNDRAYASMLDRSYAVEVALGIDNIVHGVRIGTYHLQGAPLLPLAIQELRGRFGYDGYAGQGSEIASAIQNTLIRHKGWRKRLDADLRSEADSVLRCIAKGWTALVAIPISILVAFGILSQQSRRRLTESLVFRILSLLLAFASLILTYLANRQAIHATVLQLVG